MSSNGGIGFEMAIERLHPIDTVQNQPQTTLTHWQLIKVRHSDGNFSCHLAGRSDGKGRPSTDVVAMVIFGFQWTLENKFEDIMNAVANGDTTWARMAKFELGIRMP